MVDIDLIKPEHVSVSDSAFSITDYVIRVSGKVTTHYSHKDIFGKDDWRKFTEEERLLLAKCFYLKSIGYETD